VLAWAGPERFVTLTNAPADWQKLRQKVRKLCLRLRNDGYRVEWAWTVERGARTGMRHIHALQHGDYIPQRELQERWQAIVHIERVKGARGAAGYAMKEAARVTHYAVKGTKSNLREHLDLNGGRGYHMSRRYLRGCRTREVEQLLSPSDPNLHWITVPATTTIEEGRAMAAAACPGDFSPL
jgi:hypothetical protein